MTAPAPKLQRCAVYTRKSTEHNLDLSFNSLDAQREACEAYIKSQAHEGWRLIEGRFDDGGLSGASLDRPALQSLMEMVLGRQVDIIVVYKVDRLTRSLADFAKLVEIFDENEVSFVSVTQSFNTTSSMGRLTLNVLLSFAQFEREVIGERVRDKIAASKRKGMWMGGNAPLGYRAHNKKIEIVPQDADLARKIFADYLRVGALGPLAASLAREGISPRRRELSSGRVIETERFSVGALAQMLRNRFYVGEIVYRGETFKAEHEGIIDKDLFGAVQQKLAVGAVERQKARAKSLAILSGVIFDDRGHAISPSHANKKGVRYRYYVSQALLQGDKANAGSVPRVSGPEVEALVCDVLRQEAQPAAATLPAATATVTVTAKETSPDGIFDRDFIRARVMRIVVCADHIDVTLRSAEERDGVSEEESGAGNENDGSSGQDQTRKPGKLRIPFTPQKYPRKGVASAPGAARRTIDAAARESLLKSIARARRWMEAILWGKIASFDEIAAAEDLNEAYVRRLVILAYLSPKIVAAIADGGASTSCTASALTLSLPLSWAEQEKKFAIG
jgi:site-specific DNA recombinase